MEFKFKQILLLTMLFLPLSACNRGDFNAGLRYQQEGEYDKAINSYNSAVKNNHNVALAQKNLGDIYIIRGDYKKGFESYVAAIEANHTLVLGYVMKFISDSDKNLRQTAIDYLPKVRNNEARDKMFEKLASMLKSGKLHEKIDALDLIANLGCTSEPMFNDILDLLDDENPVVKQKALYAMPTLRDCVVRFDSLNKIMAVVQSANNNELVKIAAIECIGNLKSDGKAALPMLFDLAEADNVFSESAVKAINNINISDRANAKELKKYLASAKNDTKIKVLNILGNMNSEANDMVPFIIPLLKDKNVEVRELARTTIRKIGTSSKEAVADLINLLGNPEYEIRLVVLTELSEIGKDAASALPAVEKLLKDPNENVRKYAEYAISEINK